MSEIPPPFANYPRNVGTSGSAHALRSLADGYFGLSRVFVVNIVLAFISRGLSLALKPSTLDSILMMSAAVAVVIGLVIGFMSYGPNKKIGEGAGWSPAQPVIASVLMAINSALCCGVIGYVVMQTIASNHIKRYGLKAGFFGLKKPMVEARIAEIEAQERTRPI